MAQNGTRPAKRDWELNKVLLAKGGHFNEWVKAESQQLEADPLRSGQVGSLLTSSDHVLPHEVRSLQE